MRQKNRRRQVYFVSICLLLFLSMITSPMVSADDVPEVPDGTPTGETIIIVDSPDEMVDSAMIDTNSALSGYYVIIDPGHGGTDPGAPRSDVATKCNVPSELKEKDRTLDVSRRVRDILQSRGVRVALTRDSDTTLSLLERTNFINREMPNLAVSIHANSAESCGDGVEAFYSSFGPGWKSNPHVDASKQLAQRLSLKINQKFGLRLRDGGTKDGDLHMVREPKVPSALIEMAFISNRTEAFLMRDRPADFAQAIADAISEHLGVSASCPVYRAEYFNNRTMSGPPAFVRCESSINNDWGSGGPGNGVGNDNFSVRWTGNMNFNAGNYTFIARADDGIRVSLNNSSVIEAWRDQGATEYRANRSLNAGSHSIKVEYYENGGGAVAQFRWEQASASCNASQYRAEYFNNRTLSGSPAFVRCEGWPINVDWGGGGPGNGVGNDNFSVRWTGTANFNAGSYKFIARADDGINVWFDGTQIINGWRDQGPTEYSNTRSVSSGNHNIKVEYYENGGGAVAQFRWEQASTSSSNLARNKPAYAFTQESSSYTPGKATDGSTSTRWSSGHRTSLPQWWWVDLGSTQTFDRVVIRWEAAYATRYFVGASTDDYTYHGNNYTLTRPGTYTHDIGTRTARYVGIKMDARASGMNNFSFWEVEVYRTSRSALSPTEADTVEIVFADDTIAGELVEPDGDLVTVERLLEPVLQPKSYEIFLPSTSR